MQPLQYKIHLLLTSKYFFLIKLSILFIIYMLFYAEDFLLCAPKKKHILEEDSKISDLQNLSNIRVIATPVIAESKDGFIQGFQEQLNRIELNAKTNHDELKTRLDEITQLHTTKENVIDTIATKIEQENLNQSRLFQENQRLIAENKNLAIRLADHEKFKSRRFWEEQMEQKRARTEYYEKEESLEKEKKGLITELQNLRKTNRDLVKRVGEHEETIRKLFAEQLPTNATVLEEKSHYSRPDIEEGFHQIPARLNIRRANDYSSIQEILENNCNIS